MIIFGPLWFVLMGLLVFWLCTRNRSGKYACWHCMSPLQYRQRFCNNCAWK
jgi:predicted amidophosphoribosyltransferase